MTARPVGYLVNHKPGVLASDPGILYNYLLAGNGLFIRAEGPLLRATVRVAEAQVRGLEGLDERIELVHGLAPASLWVEALRIMMLDPSRERYAAITWENGSYHVREPVQEAGANSVHYARLPNTVVDIHSHGAMRAFFSGQDDRDEQGFSASIVVGRLDQLVPEASLRVSVYGYYAPLTWQEIFAPPLVGVLHYACTP